jgi:nucleotide-binding universal stress UspA family protein
MASFKRILVPVDFSDASERALSAALGLASDLGAEIKVVHIHQVQTQYMIEGGLYAPELDEEELMEKREKELDNFIETHKGDMNIAREVRAGIPETEILEIAKEFQADLIVMGTHGRTGLSHLLMGSVTENVLRHTNVPILSVRNPD